MSFTFFALFSVMLINSIQCEMCNLEDQECITLAMKRLYPIVVAGNTELEVEPSDPLKKDKIVANLPNLNYTLTNAETHGYSNCSVREARFNTVDNVWHLFLDCPYLELNMNYDLNGFIASEKLMGKGQSKIIFDKYEISMNGGIQKEIREDKIFIQLINFEITRLEVTGKVHFSFNNLFNDDSEKTKKMNKFINDHWQEFNSQAQVPGMKAFLSVLVEHFNQYFKKVPIDKIFVKV